MTYATVSDLREALGRQGTASPEWAEKMLHLVPDLPTVKDRRAYLAEKATGKHVLDLGCSGPISDDIRRHAATYHGIDREAGPWHVACDLDVVPETMPVYPGVEIIIASELIEHLSNPGRFLVALRAAYPDVPVYLTVPQAGAYTVKNGTHEVVNKDHVAWYSYTTLGTLLRRAGYAVELARWYNGDPHTAEGLIVVAR